MADFKVYCLEGRVFPISKQEHERLISAMSTKKGLFRWVDHTGNQIVLDKIVSIEVDEFSFGAPRGIVVENVPVEQEDLRNEAQEDTPDAEIERKRAEILKDMMEKSSCKHDDQSIHYQVVLTKGGEESRRYFPVCDFCGQRFRYVKADALTEEEKEQAIEWTES